MLDRCFLLTKNPRIAIAYVCVAGRMEAEAYARHFVDTYNATRPFTAHSVTVICNGGKLPPRVAQVFSPLAPHFFVRSNDGWDVGGYIEWSQTTDADLLVCLGESVYFWRPGWIERLIEAWQAHGPGMFGFWSSFIVRPHLNTTGFAVSPEPLRKYPPPHTKRERYEFEHGAKSLWRRVRGDGLATKLVTWDGEYDPKQWRTPRNILWSGDQSNCLLFCHHTDKYFGQTPINRAKWRESADRRTETP